MKSLKDFGSVDEFLADIEQTLIATFEKGGSARPLAVIIQSNGELHIIRGEDHSPEDFQSTVSTEARNRGALAVMFLAQARMDAGVVKVLGGTIPEIDVSSHAIPEGQDTTEVFIIHIETSKEARLAIRPIIRQGGEVKLGEPIKGYARTEGRFMGLMNHSPRPGMN